MSEFTWHKKEALQEQLKFFGAKKQKFISVYAKKPRIRVEVKERESKSVNDDLIRLNNVINANLSSMMDKHDEFEAFNSFLRNQSATAMQRNNLYSSPLFGLGQAQSLHANKAARIQIEAQERAMDLQRGCATFGAAMSVGLFGM